MRVLARTLERKMENRHFKDYYKISPLSIMSTTSDLPEGFHFGDLRGTGTPTLAFCRKVMALIDEVAQKLLQPF